MNWLLDGVGQPSLACCSRPLYALPSLLPFSPYYCRISQPPRMYYNAICGLRQASSILTSSVLVPTVRAPSRAAAVQIAPRGWGFSLLPTTPRRRPFRRTLDSSISSAGLSRAYHADSTLPGIPAESLQPSPADRGDLVQHYRA